MSSASVPKNDASDLGGIDFDAPVIEELGY